MESKKELAVKNFAKGYNCAQAVFCAFSDDFGLNEETAFKMAEGFGGGMGGMQRTCGAVVAAYMAAGLKKSDGNLDHPKSKKDTYACIKEITSAFEDKNSSTICKDLKGANTGVVLRSCKGCIEDAAEIAEKILLSNN